MENGVTRFSDYRFSKKVQLSRHRGPHRTKKKFSHAICLCLVRVRKVHCRHVIARVQSCSHALLRLVDEQLRQRAAVHDHDELVGPRPAQPVPRGALRRLGRGQARLRWIVDLPMFEQWRSRTPALVRTSKVSSKSIFVENVRFVIFHLKLAQPPSPRFEMRYVRKKLRTYEMLPY